MSQNIPTRGIFSTGFGPHLNMPCETNDSVHSMWVVRYEDILLMHQKRSEMMSIQFMIRNMPKTHTFLQSRVATYVRICFFANISKSKGPRA